MPRIKLLEAGYVRGDAPVGSTHITSQSEADRLVAAGKAAYDETEIIQASEIEQLRAQVLELSGKLQTTEAELLEVQGHRQDLTDDLAAWVGKNKTLEGERDEAVRLRDEALMRERIIQEQLDDYAAAAEAKEDNASPKASAEKSPETPPEPTAGTELPEDYPEREKFIAGGYKTLEAVAKAEDDELNKVQGIGDATIKKAREYQPQSQA